MHNISSKSPLTKIIKKISITLVDFIIGLLPKNNVHTKLKNILLIRTDRIGDFVLWLNAAEELRRIYPSNKYRLTLIGNEISKDIANDVPYWDDYWPLNIKMFEKSPVYRWNFMIKVRQSNFDIVISPTYSREFYCNDSIVRIANAKEKIGSSGDLSNISQKKKNVSDKFYTKLIPATNEPLMELERNAEFIRGLIHNNFKSGIPKLPLKNNNIKKIEELSQSYYVIAPGASITQRQWKTNNFAEIIDKIYKETSWIGVILGSKNEASLGTKLMGLSKSPLIDLIGNTSLSDLAGIINNAKLFIGNESGQIHIAIAVNTPSICILGGGHFKRFMPYKVNKINKEQHLPLPVFHKMDCYNCNWRCIYANNKLKVFPCIEKISVDDVWQKTKYLINTIKLNNKND